MRAMRVTASVAVVGFVSVLTVACGGSEPAPAPAETIKPTTVGEMSPEEAGGMSAADSTLTEPKAATPHGGTLVKLGSSAHLELVHDPSSGMLTAYVLDAAGAAVMRISAKAITLEVTAPGGTATPLVLNSTANGLTGDTVGNSSQFGGTAASLKGVTAFTGVVKDVTIGAETFKDVKFGYPSNE